MTAQMIIEAAKAKDLEYQVVLMEDLSTDGVEFKIYQVGVNYRGWLWAWFTFTNNTESWALFRTTYNVATGHEDTSKRRGYAVKRQLGRGLDLWK
ncbi:MAG: hypothetical protein SNI32_06275 [Rikenellaceae bacterium]